MASSKPLRTVAALAMLLVGSVAQASAIAIAPFIPGKGVTDEDIMDVFSLLSSELEFMEGIDEVIEIEPRPAALGLTCLDSTKCLGAITRESNADNLIAGEITRKGQEYMVDVVFYDVAVNRVLRRRTYALPTRATDLVDSVTPVLLEIVTGTSPSAETASSMEDVAFSDDLAEEDEPAFGTVREVEQPVEAPAELPEADFDPNAISFGSSADDISFGDSADDITYEDPEEEEDTRVRPPPRPAFDEEEEEDLSVPPERVDFDEGTSSRTSRTNASKKGFKRAHIAVRGGYTNYGVFHFATAGGEFKVRIVDGLFVGVGIDLNIVRREKAPSLTQVEGCNGDSTRTTPPCVETNFILPFHFGLLYHLSDKRFQPYIGFDAVMSQYFRNAATGKPSWAVGARGRLGADIMFSEHVGLNLDVALGFWIGQDWPSVDPRLSTIGFLPSASAGLVFAF